MIDFVRRHRARLVEVSIVGTTTLLTLALALTFDIFPNGAGRTPKPEDLEPDELLLVGAVLLAGLVWMAIRVLRERRAAHRR